MERKILKKICGNHFRKPPDLSAVKRTQRDSGTMETGLVRMGPFGRVRGALWDSSPRSCPEGLTGLAHAHSTAARSPAVAHGGLGTSLA